MSLTSHQKHYIKKNAKKLSSSQMAADLSIPEKQIRNYLKKHDLRDKPNSSSNNLALDITTFNFYEFINNNLKSILLLFFLVAICYANSIHNAFVSDDITGILQNTAMGSWRYINSLWLVSFIPDVFIYKITPSSPELFRLFNIFLHLGSTLLIFIITSLIFQKKPIATFSAALFAVHPILIESVTWISGRPYAQYSFFFLLAFLFYILRDNNKKNYYLSLVFFFLALISSEKSIILFLLFILYELCFGNIKNNGKKLIPYISLGVVIAIYFLSRLGQRVEDLSTVYSQPDSTGLYNPFLQVPVAIASYLGLILWPQKLSLYHTEMSFSTGLYILCLLVVILFLGILFITWKKNKKLFFWLSFFIITLAPTLSPLKIAWIVAERYVYLGALGVFVAIAYGINWLMEKYPEKKNVIYSGFAIVILLLSIRTIVRNMDWQDEDSLWIATEKTSPSGYVIHNNMGDVYARHKDYDKSIEEFKKAIEINPRYAEAYHNLGNNYRDTRQFDLAIESYQKSLDINPHIWQSYQNLAAIYFEKGDYQKADEYIKKALELNPADQNLNQNLKVIESKL